MTQPRDYYTFRHDTGQFRYPLFWGSVAGLATYGAVATHDPAIQVAILAAATFTLVGSVWRVAEADRQTRPQAVKAPEAQQPTRTVDVVERHGVNSSTTRIGRLNLPDDQWRVIARYATSGKLTKRHAVASKRFDRDFTQKWGENMKALERQGLVQYDERRGTVATEQGRAIFAQMFPPPPQMTLRQRERV